MKLIERQCPNRGNTVPTPKSAHYGIPGLSIQTGIPTLNKVLILEYPGFNTGIQIGST